MLRATNPLVATPVGRGEDGRSRERLRRSTTNLATTTTKSVLPKRRSITFAVGGGAGGGSAGEAASQLQIEALEAQTRLRLARLRTQKEEERAIQSRATELEKEMAIRLEGRKRAEEVGGRRPTQRRALPIALAGVQCGALAVAAFTATQRVATALTDYETGAFAQNKTLFLNLSVGGGVAVSSLLVISTIVLFSVAVKEAGLRLPPLPGVRLADWLHGIDLNVF